MDYIAFILLWAYTIQMKLSNQDYKEYMAYLKKIKYKYPEDYMARKYTNSNKKKRFNRTSCKNATRCGNMA